MNIFFSIYILPQNIGGQSLTVNNNPQRFCLFRTNVNCNFYSSYDILGDFVQFNVLTES